MIKRVETDLCPSIRIKKWFYIDSKRIRTENRYTIRMIAYNIAYHKILI